MKNREHNNVAKINNYEKENTDEDNILKVGKTRREKYLTSSS
jgi:hypothetical protein